MSYTRMSICIIEKKIPFVKHFLRLSKNMQGVTLKAEEAKKLSTAYFFLAICCLEVIYSLKNYRYLALDERQKIEKMYGKGTRIVDIATALNRSNAAIYEELKRGATGELDRYARPQYSARIAQKTAQENFRRRGNRRKSKQSGEG